MIKNKHRKTITSKYTSCSSRVTSTISSRKNAINNNLLLPILSIILYFTIHFEHSTLFESLNNNPFKFKTNTSYFESNSSISHIQIHKLQSTDHSILHKISSMPNRSASNKRARPTTNNVDPDADNTFAFPPFNYTKHRPRGTIAAYEESPNQKPHHSKYYSSQFSLDVSGLQYDLLNILYCVIQAFLAIDPNFVFMKMSNYSIVENSEINPNNLNTMELLKDYASEIRYDKFFESSYVRFTMLIKSDEAFFGGWVFNWLRHEQSIIRLSPNICLKSEAVCFFTYATLATINFDQLYNILDAIFGRRIQKHLYERSVSLKKKGRVVRSTKGIALDVPDNEKDFATSRLFAEISKGVSIFSRHLEHIRPKPLQLSTKNSNHVSIFNDQFEWMDGKGHGVIDITFAAHPPNADDIKLIEFLMKQKNSEGNHLCLTKTQLESRFLLTCWLGDVNLVHECMEDYKSEHNVDYLLATPPASQTIRDHWAGQSIVSILSSDSESTCLVSQTSTSSKFSSNTKKKSKKAPVKQVTTDSSAHTMTEETVTKIVHKTIQPFKTDVNNRLNATDKLIQQFRNKAAQLDQTQKNIKKYQDIIKTGEETHRRNLATQFQDLTATINTVENKVTSVETNMENKFKAVHKDIATIADTQSKFSQNQKDFYANLTATLPSFPEMDLFCDETPLITQATAQDTSPPSANDDLTMEVDVVGKSQVSSLEEEQNSND